MENRYQAVAKVTRVLSEDYEPQGEEDREGDLQKKKATNANQSFSTEQSQRSWTETRRA